MYIIDLICSVCVLKGEIKAFGHKIIESNMSAKEPPVNM
jgi:hypothetical protein